MTSQLNPYLNLKDNAREAMEFYRSVFGGELTLATYADFHASQLVRILIVRDHRHGDA